MAQEQLKQAYDLIKQGRKREAVAMIQPIVKANPNNGDAWWLLANAADDTNIKRDSLKRILQIGGSEGRVSKAQQMLNSLPPEDDDFDDLFAESENDLDFTSSASSTPKRKSGQYDDPYSPENISVKKKSGGSNTCLIIIGVIVILSILACIGFSIVAYAGLNIFGETFGDALDFVSAPTEYTDLGVVEYGQTVTGAVTSTNDRIGYRINVNAGDRITIRIRSTEGEAIAPLVFFYGPDDVFMDGTNTEIDSETDIELASQAIMTTTIQTSGEHLIVVRPFFGMGISTYEMTIEGP